MATRGELRAILRVFFFIVWAMFKEGHRLIPEVVSGPSTQRAASLVDAALFMEGFDPFQRRTYETSCNPFDLGGLVGLDGGSGLRGLALHHVSRRGGDRTGARWWRRSHLLVGNHLPPLPEWAVDRMGSEDGLRSGGYLIVLLALVSALVPGPRLSADETQARELLKAQRWKKAEKAVEKILGRMAKEAAGPDERARVGELTLLRALAAAGAGDAKKADWYWWVSQMFIDKPSDELRGVAGGEQLLAAIRPIPETQPFDASKIDPKALAGSFREKGGRSLFAQRACKGISGSVRFVASSDADKLLRAPRNDEQFPNEVRSLCVFAVVNGYRTKKYGLVPNYTNRIRERL